MSRAELLHTVGEALYGPRWQTDLANDLQMSDRHMRRLAAGQATLTAGMIKDLVMVCRERQRSITRVERMLLYAGEPLTRGIP